MTDNGAIKGMDAREDGVYITYVPVAGADPVSKKLGSINKLYVRFASSGEYPTSTNTISISFDNVSWIVLRTFNLLHFNGGSAYHATETAEYTIN